MLNLDKNLPNRVKIGKKYIGKDDPTFFIADLGANHNGDYFLAKKSIEAAANAGVDAVKLQKRFINQTAAKELLERPQTKDQIFGKTYKEYREALELNEDEYKKLKEYSDSLGLIFFATPYDLASIDFLDRVGIEVYKVASQDITNLPLLEAIAKKNKPVILSIGAASWDEADEGIKTILKYNQELVIQYCVSIYPTPDDKLNMSNIKNVIERYAPLPVGYSGHEKDVLPSLFAVALGANSIERHFTLDKALPGPDHSTVSLNPEELRAMITAARRIETMFGHPIKQVHEEEVPFRNKHRKSLVSAVDIKAGTLITDKMLTCKSPGYGLKPRMKDSVIGKNARVDILADTVLTEELIDL